MLKKNSTHKISDQQVRELKKLYAEGYTQGSLARHFGIGVAQVGRIVRGESRRDVGGAAPSPAEMDRIAQKLMELQAQVNGYGTREEREGELRRTPPPMLTEGGDAPSEVDGSALGRLQEVAEHDGLDIDKALQNPLTAPGGAYDFINRKGT